MDKLASTVVKALAEPETRDKLAAIGVVPGGPAGTEFAGFLREEKVRWTQAVRESRVPLD